MSTTIPITTPVITTIDFNTLVADMVTQWQASTGTNYTTSPGDVLLAIFQAVAGNAIFLEGLANELANFGRAQTSSGVNLDTWMAQFGFVRIVATAAEGTVTLSTASVLGYNVVIPVGTIIQTSGGAIQYQLIADTTQTAYSASQNAYIIVAGQTSISATAQCTTLGTAGNVSANQLNQLASSIPGLATVTNQYAINNGEPAETDTAFFNRWLGYLSGLSSATLTAIEGAVNSGGTNLDFQVVENETQTGATQYGLFTVAVEQSYLPPSSTLLTTISNAVNKARAFTVQATVMAPAIVTLASITMTVHLTATGTNSAIQTTLANFVNNLVIGSTVHISDLISTALANGAASVKGDSTLINGTNNDLVLTELQVPRTTPTNITISNY